MKKAFFYIVIIIMVMAAPKIFAQSASNTDFNPFPQMEQDQQNVDSDTASQPQQQNDDWPPGNGEVQTNSEGVS